MEEGVLFHEAKHSFDLTIQIDKALTEETGEYTQELTELLTALTMSRRDISQGIPATEEISIRQRLRKLLVLLKGNDVWVYHTHQVRRLPERHNIPPEDEKCTSQFHLVLAFGPPGEYGETSILVDVDNGQPWVLSGWGFAKQEGK
jgi:hypothetical protein